MGSADADTSRYLLTEFARHHLDSPEVLKQMIAELIRALRSERRDREALQQRLDALLRRYYAPRPEDPNQPLLFPPPADEIPEPPPATPRPSSRAADTGPTSGRSGRGGELELGIGAL